MTMIQELELTTCLMRSFTKSANQVRLLVVNLPPLLQAYIWKEYIHMKRHTYEKRTSLVVVQWLRFYLPMQGTQVWSLVCKDSTCLRATKAMYHNYWTCALEPRNHNCLSSHSRACELQLLKPACHRSLWSATREATTMRSLRITTKSSLYSLQPEKALMQQRRPSAAKNK